MEAWHFLRVDRRLAYPPHTLVIIGQKITVDPDKLKLCEYGLHASIRALDALRYAPGPIICRVKLGDRLVETDDKVCASERTVIAMADATDTLRAFARSCALDVIDNWAAPAVVREYLETGNEEMRESAWSAAARSAESAVQSARSAAESAVWSAVWSAKAAAWSAKAAAESARSTARSAARSAELAAQSAAKSLELAQNERLEAMLNRLLEATKLDN